MLDQPSRSIFFLSTLLFAMSCSSPQKTPVPDSHSPQEKEWFISTSGSDAEGSGNLASPYRSFKKLKRKISPGDTVVFRKGTYKGGLQVTLKGTPDKWITIKAYPGEKVIFHGGLNLKNAKHLAKNEAEEKSKYEGLVDVRFSKFIRIQDLEVSHAKHYGVNIWESEHITVSNCRVHHTWSRGVGGCGDAEAER